MRLLALVLAPALVAIAATAGAARAAGEQTITPYMCPASSGLGGFGTGAVVSAAESGGDPVQLKFGWAALQTGQLDKFISAEAGSVTLTDPSDDTVFSDSWGGAPTGWEYPYLPATLTANGTSFVQGYGTRRLEQLGTLSNPIPGTDAVYRLTMTWTLRKGVNDGFGAYPPGPIVQLVDCPITVRNYNAGP